VGPPVGVTERVGPVQLKKQNGWSVFLALPWETCAHSNTAHPSEIGYFCKLARTSMYDSSAFAMFNFASSHRRALRDAAGKFDDVHDEPPAFLVSLELQVEREIVACDDLVDSRVSHTKIPQTFRSRM
jgi:hypothetical protein